MLLYISLFCSEIQKLSTRLGRRVCGGSCDKAHCKVCTDLPAQGGLVFFKLWCKAWVRFPSTPWEQVSWISHCPHGKVFFPSTTNRQAGSSSVALLLRALCRTTLSTTWLKPTHGRWRKGTVYTGQRAHIWPLACRQENSRRPQNTTQDYSLGSKLKKYQPVFNSQPCFWRRGQQWCEDMGEASLTNLSSTGLILTPGSAARAFLCSLHHMAFW